MKAIKAAFKNGKIKLLENPPKSGPTEVLVVFPEVIDDPWDAILRDPNPRPALAARVKKLKAEIARGKASRLDIEKL